MDKQKISNLVIAMGDPMGLHRNIGEEIYKKILSDSEATEEYVVKVYNVAGETIVEITNLNNVAKKISLQGKLADELLETFDGFHKLIK